MIHFKENYIYIRKKTLLSHVIHYGLWWNTAIEAEDIDHTTASESSATRNWKNYLGRLGRKNHLIFALKYEAVRKVKFSVGSFFSSLPFFAFSFPSFPFFIAFWLIILALNSTKQSFALFFISFIKL